MILTHLLRSVDIITIIIVIIIIIIIIIIINIVIIRIFINLFSADINWSMLDV